VTPTIVRIHVATTNEIATAGGELVIMSSLTIDNKGDRCGVSNDSTNTPPIDVHTYEQNHADDGHTEVAIMPFADYDLKASFTDTAIQCTYHSTAETVATIEPRTGAIDTTGTVGLESHGMKAQIEWLIIYSR
jgi:hypothetical protein